MSDNIYADYSETSSVVAQVAAPSRQPAVRQEKKRSGAPKLIILALLVTAGVTVWWSVARATSLDSRDLAYLPDDSALIVQLKGGQLTNSPLYAELKKFVTPYAKVAGPGNASELLQAIESRIDTVTIGVKSPESLRQPGDQQFAGVFRCSQDLLVADFTPANLSREEVVAGKTMSVANDAAVCQIDARTIAFGSANTLREVLQRGGVPATTSPQLTKALDAADFSQTLTIVAVAPEKPADEFQQMGRMAGFDLPESFILNADLNSDLRLSGSIVMKEESDLRELMKQLEPALERAKQCERNRRFLDALDISTSGTTLTVAATVPGSLIREALEHPPEPLARNNNQAVNQCLHDAALLNSHVERFYFETGRWPRDIAEMAKTFDKDLPPYCSLHRSAYRIDPQDHRVTDRKSPAPSQAANTSKFSLQAVRFAIGAFQDDHGGVFPSLTNGGLPGLVERTSLDDACDDDCSFGPYLSRIPKNMLNGLATVKQPEQVPPQSADGTTGWYYDPQSGGIWLNSNVSGLAEFTW